jgi:hypothetical protein
MISSPQGEHIEHPEVHPRINRNGLVRRLGNIAGSESYLKTEFISEGEVILSTDLDKHRERCTG